MKSAFRQEESGWVRITINNRKFGFIINLYLQLYKSPNIISNVHLRQINFDLGCGIKLLIRWIIPIKYAEKIEFFNLI